MHRQITLLSIIPLPIRKSLIKFCHLSDNPLKALFEPANKNMGFVKGGERLFAGQASMHPLDDQLLKNIVLFFICCIINSSFEKAL